MERPAATPTWPLLACPPTRTSTLPPHLTYAVAECPAGMVRALHRSLSCMFCFVLSVCASAAILGLGYGCLPRLLCACCRTWA